MISLVNILNNIKPEESKRNYIGASAIGHPCMRKIWYEYKGFDKAPVDARVQRIFDIGNSIEDYLKNKLFYLSLFNVDLSNPYKQHGYLKSFQGNADSILILPDGSRVILEIKSCNHTSFLTFQRKGLRAWNEQYYYQVQSYMGLFNIKKAVVLAMDKDTQELHEEWVDFDPEFYESICEKVQAITEANAPPPRLHGSPLYYVCKMCPFNEICHKEK